MALTQEQLNRILGKQSVVDRVLSTNAIEQKLNAPENIVTGGILPIQKNKVTGQMALAMPEFIKSIQQAYTAPARAMRGEFDPNSMQGVQEANNVALNLLGVGSAPSIGKPMQQGSLGITAYHGSPYKFEKFDASKIGSGEGVQAYGHGLYFAEAPAVAKNYQDTLGIQKTSMSSMFPDYLDTTNLSPSSIKAIHNIATDKSIPIEKSAKVIQNSNIALRNENPSNLTRLVNDFRNASEGFLYKVDIPDEKIATMINWNKPLSEQNDVVKNWLKSPYNFYRNELKKPDVGGQEPTGQLIVNRLQQLMSQGNKNNIFENNANYGSIVASKEMQDAGISGVKYLDEISRFNPKLKEQGTSNLVVFDPNIIKILERNGLLLP
jgi:hypothetical protein